MTAEPGTRRVVAVALVVVAVLVGVVAGRARQGWADDPDARAAYAEHLVAVDARDQAVAQADEARRLGADGASAAAQAEGVAREAGEHAERLRAEWATRWRAAGLGR